MNWQKIKQKIMGLCDKRISSFTTKFNPDTSVEFTFGLSSPTDIKKFEEMFQRFASENIKTIGNLSTEETSIGLVAAAMYFFHMGKYIASTRYAEVVLKNEPRNNSLRIWLITVYGNYIGSPDAKQKAVDMCEEAIKREQNNYKPHFLKALYTSHIKTKTPNESISLYLKAKELMEAQELTKLPDYGLLCSFLGPLYLKESNDKNKKQAETLFRQAISVLELYSDGYHTFWLNHTKELLEKLLASTSES